MATIANIAVQDGKATPLTHTFNAIKSGESSLWRTSDSALPLVGQEVIKVTLKSVSPGVKNVVVSLDLPALETATGANSSGYTAAPKVGYTNRLVCSFLLPERGTAAQRTDLRVLLKNLLTNAIVIDSIDNLTPPF